MIDDFYFTIEKPAKGYFKDKGSKFYSFAYPLCKEDDSKEILSGLRKEHHAARHHCYAWRLGANEISYRVNDDGEPSSTAGKPILGQLRSFNVTNILVVVIRYFGGTLLGVSGLINAYRNAASDALNNAEIVKKNIENEVSLHFTYNELSEVMKVIKEEKLTILNSQFREKCDLTFTVRLSVYYRVMQIFSSIYGVEIKKQSQ